VVLPSGGQARRRSDASQSRSALADELTATIDEVAAEEVWVTHGREEALVYYATQKGYRARALSLTGFEEDE